jgi:hypothetical protein
MSSRKTTTSFQSNLSKLGSGKAIGLKRDNPLQGFSPSSPINFGKPSDRNSLASTSSSGTDWGGLAKQVVSGGAASLFGSGSANGLFGGLGSLVSGITSLFGGSQQKTLPALTLFQLPDAVNQTVHMQSAAPAAGNAAVHVHVQAMDTQSFVNRSNDIARAVKTAMLNSHSLNDVVSEL